MSFDHQDWKSVVLNGNKSSAKVAPSPGSPKKVSYNDAIKGDIDESMQIIKVDKQLSQDILKARLAKGLSQVDLAKQMSLDVNIIKTYENGTATHNGAMVSKFKKFLNIHK